MIIELSLTLSSIMGFTTVFNKLAEAFKMDAVRNRVLDWGCFWSAQSHWPCGKSARHLALSRLTPTLMDPPLCVADQLHQGILSQPVHSGIATDACLARVHQAQRSRRCLPKSTAPTGVQLYIGTVRTLAFAKTLPSTKCVWDAGVAIAL